jgi:PAS domain S-box-containing protein
MNVKVRERRLLELRRQAETLLAEKIKDVSRVEFEDVKEIVYELQVHRIELEMQNEELRRIQSELQESQDKYLHLYNSAPIGYFTLDRNGAILEVNATGAELFGMEKPKLLTTNFTHLISPDSQDKFYLHCKKLFKTAASQYCELTFLRKDSIHFYAQLESIILPDGNGELNQHQVIVIDITERKRAEEKAREIETLKEIEQLRTELLANISHELRTPLTSIKGFSTMLLEYDKRLSHKEKQKFLKTIDLASDRLLELIDQLLDMSRLDAGILTIDNKPTNINKLIQDVVNEAQVRSAGHRLQLDLPRNLPRLSVDARRIRQVLENLISNAVKYSKANTEIKIAAQCDVHELLISVADKGIGIPQEELPKVFDRFFRSRRSQFEGIKGVGLGLSICKSLVEAEGGRIWMESEEGKGSVCFFTLPINIIPGDNDNGKS